MANAASGSHVGVSNEKAFGVLAAQLDNKTLILPSGGSVQVGKYGNPIPTFAPAHAPDLRSLNLEIVDHGSVQQAMHNNCLLYTSPSPRDKRQSRMPSSA